jgi:hypothetical protein
MKHKHEKWIHLMADGVRIETDVNGEWIVAYWGDFNDNNLTFRISPNQPADANGWIPWHGGETLAISERIDVRFKNWPTQENTTAGQWRWEIRDRETDIVAYRIVKDKVKKWRWMYTIASNNSTDCLYLTNAMTEAEVKEWVARRGMTTLGPRQDWTEVECDE